MVLREGLAIVLPLLLLVFSAPAVALAATHPDPSQVLTLSPQRAGAGQFVECRAAGFAPDSQVSLALDSNLLDIAFAGETGRLSCTVRIPLDTPSGRHRLTATGSGPDGRPLVLAGRLSISRPSSRLDLSVGELAAGLILAGSILVLSGLGLEALRRSRARTRAGS